MFKQIVVGVDEHEGGRDAIALAKKLAAPDGQLTLAFVYCGDPYVYRGVSAAFEATERERTLERLEAVRAEAGIDAKLSFVGSSSAGTRASRTRGARRRGPARPGFLPTRTGRPRPDGR